MHEPVTPAGLPRNREADVWRAKCNAARDALWNTRSAVFPLALVCMLLVVALASVTQDRDAARAQVAAAEQRAERAEAVRDAVILRMDSVMPGQRSVFVCPRDGACAFVQDCAPDTAPPRVIYDDVGIQRWEPAGTATVPGTPCTSGVPGALCVYDRGQP